MNPMNNFRKQEFLQHYTSSATSNVSVKANARLTD
jgi:hypothetical protein